MKKFTSLLSLLLLVFASCENDKKTGVVSTPKSATLAINHKNIPLSLDSLLVLAKPKTFQKAYRSTGYTTLWHNKADRDSLLSVIKTISDDGLLPEDYNVGLLEAYEANNESDAKQSIEHDLLLTETFYKLANHLFKGKVAPSDVYPDWDLKIKDLDVNKLLTEALENHSVKEVLDRCRPSHKIYTSLRNSLKYINALPDDSKFNQIPFTILISPDETDSIAIPLIKRRLLYWNDIATLDTVSPVYDVNMHNAIKKFQLRHGLPPHGKIDSTTVAELNIRKKQRVEQIIVNLERWRWFPYTLGEKSVLVNIPDYQLAVLEKNDTVQLHKVIVGRPERRTPVLQSSFYSIVVNPTWTVPPTIIKEDLTPAALQDPDYFSKHNMTIYDNKDKPIDPFTWDFTKANSYRYVQGPGPHNSLGEIKFNFGNTRKVYLHDTNHKGLFKNRYRSLSSGCVRIENPVKLAAYMLLEDKKNKLSEEMLNELITKRETVTINIKKSIRMNQFYWTAWMDKNGLQFRQDIYDLDNALYDKLTTKAMPMPAYSSLTDDR